MKKSLFFIFAIWFAVLGVGCSEKFDDTQIWDKLNSLETRVAALEQLCRQMNTNITSLQTIVEALQNKDYITNIAPINEEGKVIGYTLTFSKSGNITIYHGKDASAPSVGVKKYEDNLYYWTLNGEWLLNDEGNKIRAEGIDGISGLNGITPKLKIEDDYWYVSYDNEATWTKLYKATGEDGANGDSMFSQVTYDDDCVYFTLIDGTKLEIPRRPQLQLNNEIWYTSSIGQVVIPFDENGFGANVVSNTYNNGKGVIKFDGNVTSIGNSAFQHCTGLTSITIPESVTSIEYGAFMGCTYLTSITIPNSVIRIEQVAFYDCRNLTSITIPSSVTSIGVNAFFGCSSLTSITIPNSVTSIGNYAFKNCTGLTSITIPNSVTSIGDFAFKNCTGLTSITIPNSVTSFGDYAFSACTGLTSVTISEGVTSIGSSAFKDTGLTSITIPNSVTSIGDYAFCGCGLTSIYIKAINPPSLDSYAFYNNDAAAKIYVPMESVDAYKSADGWYNYANKIVGYDFGE